MEKYRDMILKGISFVLKLIAWVPRIVGWINLAEVYLLKAADFLDDYVVNNSYKKDGE